MQDRPPEDGLPEIIGHITDADGRQHTLRPGPIQHERLTPDQLQRIARLRDALVDAYPMTLDGWIDGFMRDLNPEREIQVVEACAVTYLQLTSATSLLPEEAQALYGIICVVSTGGRGAKLAAKIPKDKGLPSLEVITAMLMDALESGFRP